MTKEQYFLGEEPSINKTIGVTTTSAEISVPKFRKVYSIRNTSTAGQVISIALSNNTQAVAGEGIVLNPNESFVDSDSEGYDCWTGSIRAISSAINATLSVMERV